LGRKTADRFLNSLFVIRNDGLGQDIPAAFFRGCFHCGAAEVLVLTATSAIRNGNYADDNLHFAQIRAVILSRADNASPARTEGSYKQG
jgi:hypothetical protein